jgi:hypothetical protein
MSRSHGVLVTPDIVGSVVDLKTTWLLDSRQVIDETQLIPLGIRKQMLIAIIFETQQAR